MSAAEQGQSRYIQIADRLARFYSPAVHTLAAATLTGWLLLGMGWHASIMAAVAVLIITCPCALGLAVPAAQVVASGRLFRSGVMIKNGAALEKLSGVDTVIFDKTGTLTKGEPQLVSPLMVSTETLTLAAGLAQASKHPLSRRWCARRPGAASRPTTSAMCPNIRASASPDSMAAKSSASAAAPGAGWRKARKTRASSNSPSAAAPTRRSSSSSRMRSAPRPPKPWQRLKQMGLAVHLLSGDREAAVTRVAKAVADRHRRLPRQPAGQARLCRCAVQGRQTRC